MRALVIAMALFVSSARTAPAQYIYLDSNGDGVCTSQDVLSPSSTAVDLWLDLNHDADGSTVTCAQGAEPLSMAGYSVVLTYDSGGSITYGTYTNLIAEFTVTPGETQGGTYLSTIYLSGGALLSPGLYKIGTLALTNVTGSPILSIAPSFPANPPYTEFYSECAGAGTDNSIRLTRDFDDQCGTTVGTPVSETTWGKIKSLYR
jgi:hypothetical protein